MVGIIPEKAIITNPKKSLEVGRMVSIEISGGIRPWAFTIRGEVLSRQAIWIGGNWGTMVPIARWGYLENHDGACDYEDMNNQTDIVAYKVCADDNIIRKNKEENNDPLNNFGGKCMGCGRGGSEMVCRE